MAKKYPVGTKIRYIGYCKKCKGNTGEVVREYELSCRITLPHSRCNGVMNGTIVCSWRDIELLVKKNQQLLFSFMES